MKKQLPVTFLLKDETKVEAVETEDKKGVTFLLDKPTGQTDSFSLPNVIEGQHQSPANVEEDAQRKEAVELFLFLQNEK